MMSRFERAVQIGLILLHSPRYPMDQVDFMRATEQAMMAVTKFDYDDNDDMEYWEVRKEIQKRILEDH